jgi:MscS family membrane protein
MVALARNRFMFVRASLVRRLAVLLAVIGGVARAGQPVERHPLEPADLSSPRAALRSFLDRSDAVFHVIQHQERTAAAAQRVRRMAAGVVGCLDLREVAPSLMESKGREAAVCLKEVFDRIALPPDAEIPDADEVEREGLKRWRLPHTEIALVRVADGAREGEWLFDADTVARADEFFRRVRDLPYRTDAGSPGFHATYVRAAGWMIPEAWIMALPEWTRATMFEETVWRWISLGLLVAAGAGVVAGAYAVAGRAAARGRHRLVVHVLACAAPASLIAVGAVVDYLLTYQVRLTGDVLLACKAGLRVVMFGGGILLALGVLRHLADLVILARGLRPGGIDTQLVRLGFKIVTGLVVAWMVIVGASWLGISVAPLLAGLGVSGLAVALAAQHTVENVIAGLVLFADKPVRIGDSCAFEGVQGTVEQIGLRSTRIRCPDRTVITLPNSEFAKLQLTNFSRRDRILLRTVLTLRCETTGDQLRFLLADLRRMLADHPRIAPESVRVRFTGYGEWSLNVEVFALADTTSPEEFLAIQEDVLLRIMDVVRDAGSDFAYPSQTQYVPTDAALDADRRRRAEDAVAALRQEGGLGASGFLDVDPPARRSFPGRRQAA